MVQLDMLFSQGITLLFIGSFPSPGFVLTPMCLELSPSSLVRPGMLDFMCTLGCGCATVSMTTDSHLHDAVVHQEGCALPVQEPTNKAVVL